MATKTYKPKRKISATESEEIKIPASSVDGLSTVATSGSYNDLSNKPTIPDVSGKANLSGGNTFTGKQTLNSPASDGYSINASGYIKGSWLQASAISNKGSNTGKVCVFDNSGWIYYRTPTEILTEAGGAKASDIPTKTSQLTNDSGYTTNKGTVTQVKINGTTKSPDSAGLVDLGTISGGGGSSNVIVDRPMIQGVEYTVFDRGEYGSFIGTFSLETQDSSITITVGNADYIITNNDWVHCRITIDKNDEFVYSTIAINTGNVNRTWFFSTLPSGGAVKISTDLTSSYLEHNVCVIMKEVI